MLRCSDKSYYVGSTSHDDVAVRVVEHNEGRYPGFTAKRRPVVLIWSKHFDRLEDAHEAERRLKGWSRAKKEALIAGDHVVLESLARRRTGLPRPKATPPTRRQLVDQFKSIGATKQGKAPVRTQRKSRHPEVRDPVARQVKLLSPKQLGRAPKDIS
jgi:putative endonuclease